MNGIVTLLTDFGTQDGYVGAVKGVIASENPQARVVDITHEVPPQDVIGGAFVLAQAARYFPPGTIHLAVVDPGVGTQRRGLVIEAGGSLFIGPDNGLLSLAAPTSTAPGNGSSAIAWAIDRVPRSWRVHPTFHGRDLFARIAARLAGGAEIAEFATLRVSPLRLMLPRIESSGYELIGQVIHVDRFGNLITNLRGDEIGGAAVAISGTLVVRTVTYGEVERGQLLACVSSSGYLEIAVRDGSAAATLHCGRGTRVRAPTR